MKKRLKTIIHINSLEFKLIFSTAVAQAVSFLTTIFIARIIAPSDFGKYSTIFFVISLSLPLVSGKLDLLIINLHDEFVNPILEIYVRNVLKRSLLPTSLITLIAFQFWSLSFTKIVVLTVISYLTSCMSAFLIMVTSLALRRREYMKINTFGLSQNFNTLVIQFITIFLNKNFIVLVTSFVIGRLVSIIFSPMHRAFIKVCMKAIQNNQSSKEFSSDILSNSRKFAATSFMESMIIYIPFFVALLLENEKFLGNLSLALSLVVAPITLFVSGTNLTFLKRPLVIHEGRLIDSKQHINANLLLLLIFMFVYLISFALLIPLGIRSVFGSEWNVAAFMIQILSIPMSFNILFSSIINLKIGRNEVNHVFKIYFAGFTFSILGTILSLLMEWSLYYLAFSTFASKALGQGLAIFYFNRGKG